MYFTWVKQRSIQDFINLIDYVAQIIRNELLTMVLPRASRS